MPFIDNPSVAHTTEIAFVYGTTPDTSPLSNIMMDYWLSFGTSLTPNDGKGSKRMLLVSDICWNTHHIS